MRQTGSTRRGYAMVLMLTIALVMSVTSIALVNATTTDLNGARQLLGRSEARLLATSGLDEFYARFATNPAFFAPLLDDNEGTVIRHPAFTPANQVKSPAENWARFDGANVVPCAQEGENPFDQDCFTATATVERTTRSGTSTTSVSDSVRAVLVDITSRVRCGGIESRCVYARAQQRIRPQQFYNSLLYYQFTTLDPLLYPPADVSPPPTDGLTQEVSDQCADLYALPRGDAYPTGRPSFCVSVAFNKQDVISGPVTTLDNYIVTCGNPQFQDTVRVYGGYVPANGIARAYATALELASAAVSDPDGLPTDCGTAEPQFLLPPSLVVDPTFQLPPATTSIARAASIASLTFTQTDATQPVDMTFSTRVEGEDPVTTLTVTNTDKGNTFTVDLPSPANEVIVVRSAAVPTPTSDLPKPVQIKGTVSGRVSVFADKDVKVAGDILYHGGQNSSNTQDILGIIAGEDIILKKPTTSGTTGSDLTVAAIATSLGGSIYTEDWDKPAAPGVPTWSPGALTWFGTLSSMYQGVFGGYSLKGGNYVSGYRKNFGFDSRPASGIISPPYVASPDRTSWVRLAALEVPPDR